MCFHFWKQSRKIVFDIYFSNITIQTPSQTRLRAMRQNQTINPFPQSRQIGKGGGILNTLYEIGFGIKLQYQDIRGYWQWPPFYYVTKMLEQLLLININPAHFRV